MNRKIDIRWWAVLLVLGCVMSGYAASFGTGANAFELTFQPISGETNPSAEHNYGQVAYDYGIGTYEITADQWAKYVTSSGGPVGAGAPYNSSPTTSGSQAVNYASWYEAAQFVNWLNTSSGYAPAYNFDDEGGMSLWSDGERSATSAYRHKDAIYVLPSSDEWMKAAFWDGLTLQDYATPDGEVPTTTEANYNDDFGSVWSVGTGAVELNGTYDMMGNVSEWFETSHNGKDYISADRDRLTGGGSYSDDASNFGVGRWTVSPESEYRDAGFRVVAIPEPVSLVLIGLFGGGILVVRRMFMK